MSLFIQLTTPGPDRRRAAAWLLALCLPAAAAARAAPAAAVSGVVTQVLDAATVRFTPAGGGAPMLVRVRDIDPPEPCQPWGPEAKAALSALVLNKSATLQAAGRDGRGRPLVALTVDGASVSRRMVEEGHAWSIRTRDDKGPLVKQERMAKALGRGLHGTAGAVMPRDWRRTKGACPAGV